MKPQVQDETLVQRDRQRMVEEHTRYPLLGFHAHTGVHACTQMLLHSHRHIHLHAKYFFLKEENDIKVKGPRKGLVVMLRTKRRVHEGICEGDGQALWAAAFTYTTAT